MQTLRDEAVTVGRVESVHPNLDGPHTAIIDLGDTKIVFSSEHLPSFQNGDSVAVRLLGEQAPSKRCWQGRDKGRQFALCTEDDLGRRDRSGEDIVRLPHDLVPGSPVPIDALKKKACESGIPRAMHVFPNWVSG